MQGSPRLSLEICHARKSVYFLRKNKMTGAFVFWFFAARFSAEALRICARHPSRTLYGIRWGSKAMWRFCGDLVACTRGVRYQPSSAARLRRASTAVANRYNDIPTMAFQWWRFHNINSGRYHYAGTMHASSPCFWDGESSAIHTRYHNYIGGVREIVISP